MVREGERVEAAADGASGTIRYVGPVATSKDASAVYYGTTRDVYSLSLSLCQVTLFRCIS